MLSMEWTMRSRSTSRQGKPLIWGLCKSRSTFLQQRNSVSLPIRIQNPSAISKFLSAITKNAESISGSGTTFSTTSGFTQMRDLMYALFQAVDSALLREQTWISTLKCTGESKDSAANSAPKCFILTSI